MYLRMRTWKTSVNSFACNLDKAARILAEFLTLEYPLNKNKCGAFTKRFEYCNSHIYSHVGNAGVEGLSSIFIRS